MFQAIANILAIADLRRRLLFTFMALAIYRIGFHIYLPGVRLEILAQVKENVAACETRLTPECLEEIVRG